MRLLSLFTGGGLGDYGLELAGMETVGQCEINKYCRKLLGVRWPDVPKWGDIREVTGESVREKCGRVDVISGGFPCQPFSIAGQQRGKEDDRYLWPQMLRVIREVQPTWVIAENVPGLIHTALDDVLADLESEGYETITIVFPAHAFGAPHKRDRLWIIAHTNKTGRGELRWSKSISEEQSALKCDSEVVANPSINRLEEGRKAPRAQSGGFNCSGWWEIEPRMGRVADGCPSRVDRLKLLGNGQVVQAAQWVGEQIMKFGDKEA